jgi:hypothetical protein
MPVGIARKAAIENRIQGGPGILKQVIMNQYGTHIQEMSRCSWLKSATNLGSPEDRPIFVQTYTQIQRLPIGSYLSLTDRVPSSAAFRWFCL